MKAKTYLEKYTKVRSGLDKTIPFVATDIQKKIFNAIENNDKVMLVPDDSLSGCDVVEYLTAVVGFLYHRTITEKGTTTVFIVDKDSVKIVSDIVMTFYSSTPDNIKPKVKYHNRSRIYFPELSSCIIIVSSVRSLCGWTMNNVFVHGIDENKQNHEFIMMSIDTSVPIGGKIIIDNPPKGSIFYKAFNNDEWNGVKEIY